MKTPILKDYLTTDQVADELGMDGVTLRRWLRKGNIRGIQIGRTWLVSKAEIKRVKGKEIDKRKSNALESRWKK